MNDASLSHRIRLNNCYPQIALVTDDLNHHKLFGQLARIAIFLLSDTHCKLRLLALQVAVRGPLA